MNSDLLTIARSVREGGIPPAQPQQGLDPVMDLSACESQQTTASAPLPEGLETFRIETWGCQMNAHDSERMAALLTAIGLRPSADDQVADVILLNTCSIRERASEKVFSRLGQLRRTKQSKPGMVIGVCGCVAQQEQERIFARAPCVDLVLGPRRLAELPRLIHESRARRHAMAVFDPRDQLVPEAGGAIRNSRTRAWITIMEGCNKNCTFCIVPVTRGRETCRHPEAILREVREVIEQGYCEIELLGQNVNAWRHSGSDTWDFTRLLSTVALEPGVRRLRFTTSHPLHFRDSIIDVMARHPALCRHLHLPVQSGSDEILRRMHRGHTAADYRDRVSRLRERIPDAALSSDIIVGFPGESESDFDQTLDLVRTIRFDSIYSFIYSPRPGTPAAEYPDTVCEEEKKGRLHRLQEIQNTIQLERNRRWEGEHMDVLVEGPAHFPPGSLTGRTSQNHRVIFEGDPSLVGKVLSLRIVTASTHSLRADRPQLLTSAAGENIVGPLARAVKVPIPAATGERWDLNDH